MNASATAVGAVFASAAVAATLNATGAADISPTSVDRAGMSTSPEVATAVAKPAADMPAPSMPAPPGANAASIATPDSASPAAMAPSSTTPAVATTAAEAANAESTGAIATVTVVSIRLPSLIPTPGNTTDNTRANKPRTPWTWESALASATTTLNESLPPVAAKSPETV